MQWDNYAVIYVMYFVNCCLKPPTVLKAALGQQQISMWLLFFAGNMQWRIKRVLQSPWKIREKNNQVKLTIWPPPPLPLCKNPLSQNPGSTPDMQGRYWNCFILEIIVSKIFNVGNTLMEPDKTNDLHYKQLLANDNYCFKMTLTTIESRAKIWYQ